MSLSQEQVLTKLKECYDPELPCNIVDLGLVYDVRLEPDPQTNDVRIDIKMTLTSQGCPLASQISAQVQRKLLELPAVAEANVEIIFEPPWNFTRISADGKKLLCLP